MFTPAFKALYVGQSNTYIQGQNQMKSHLI